MMDVRIDRSLDQIPFRRDNLKTDSRDVRPGDIFVAIKGTVHDGHDHVTEALKNGAAYVLCEREVQGLPGEEAKKIIAVESTKKALGVSAKRVFGDPSAALTVHGITGTNGKTTTAFLIDSVLNSAGMDSGLVTTVFTKTSGNDISRSSMTTPDPVKLNCLLSDMVASGKRAAVIEISSHALDQERVYGIGLDSAVFTNITPEHLDYHGTMEKYLKDKARIFENLKPGGAAVLNADDPSVVGLRDAIDAGSIMTFGIKEDADVSARDIGLSSEGTEFDLVFRDSGTFRVKTRLVGKHNVYNILASAAVLIGCGLEIDIIGKATGKALSVPGRLEMVAENTPFQVFVDYAHTPDALENVLGCLRGLAERRLICVFGCGGDRDRTKRPAMGRIAAGICDRVVLTSDNPRSEEPREILKEIEKGVPRGTDYSIIMNREEAILEALGSAKEKDIVVITGKGHEDHQIIGDRVIEFDDKKVALEILRKLGY